MAKDNYNLDILENGKKIYKPDQDFAIEHDELLRLFSLYISFDPDYSYNSTYLLDKIYDFSREMKGYYKKQQIIEDATNKWISDIPVKKKVYLEGIIVSFDEVFELKGSLGRIKLKKVPSLQEVRANHIKVTCQLNKPEITDCEKVELKNGDNRAIDDIVNLLSRFLDKVIQNSNIAKDDKDEK